MRSRLVVPLVVATTLLSIVALTIVRRRFVHMKVLFFSTVSSSFSCSFPSHIHTNLILIKRVGMIANAKINILVYSGDGTSERSRIQSIQSLKAHLGSNYAIQPVFILLPHSYPYLCTLSAHLLTSFIKVSTSQLLDEPWEETTALLVIPGGADIPYVRDLSPKGTAKIRKFVESGGNPLPYLPSTLLHTDIWNRWIFGVMCWRILWSQRSSVWNGHSATSAWAKRSWFFSGCS